MIIIYVKRFSGRTFTFEVNLIDQINSISQQIETMSGNFSHIQRLYFKSKIVDTSKTFGFYNFQNHDYMIVTFQNLRITL